MNYCLESSPFFLKICFPGVSFKACCAATVLGLLFPALHASGHTRSCILFLGGTHPQGIAAKESTEDKWSYSVLILDWWFVFCLKTNFLLKLHRFPTLSIGEKTMPVWYSSLCFSSCSSVQCFITKSHVLSVSPKPPLTNHYPSCPQR